MILVLARVEQAPEVTKRSERNRDGFADTRRNLIAFRTKHGADTPIGRCCSSLVEMVDPRERSATFGYLRATYGDEWPRDPY
jgi:hypothetical protein